MALSVADVHILHNKQSERDTEVVGAERSSANQMYISID